MIKGASRSPFSPKLKGQLVNRVKTQFGVLERKRIPRTTIGYHPIFPLDVEAKEGTPLDLKKRLPNSPIICDIGPKKSLRKSLLGGVVTHNGRRYFVPTHFGVSDGFFAYDPSEFKGGRVADVQILPINTPKARFYHAWVTEEIRKGDVIERVDKNTRK